MEENNSTPTAPTSKSKAPVFIGIFVLVAIGIGIYFMNGIKNSKIQAPVESQTDIVKTYSLADVATHSTEKDCWLVIDGNVYDVSSFVPKHPGEEKILLGCGKDATELFATKAGKGIPHSAKAVNLREEFKIGILSGT